MRTVFSGALFIAAVAQFAFAYHYRELHADFDVIPIPPSRAALDLQAFGDSQFLYRQLAHDLQNFGDTGGRVTAMRDYDPGRVIGWLQALDGLDPNAAYHMYLAVRYFSQTPEPESLRRLVRYIAGRADKNPSRHAIWTADAIYIAQVRLRDLELAREVASVLDRHDPHNIPLLVRQLPAFLAERSGDYSGAAASMEGILASWGSSVTRDEKAYMELYIQEMKKHVANPPLYPSHLLPPPPAG